METFDERLVNTTSISYRYQIKPEDDHLFLWKWKIEWGRWDMRAEDHLHDWQHTRKILGHRGLQKTPRGLRNKDPTRSLKMSTKGSWVVCVPSLHLAILESEKYSSSEKMNVLLSAKNHDSWIKNDWRSTKSGAGLKN